jgi:hypothetical protein
MSRVLARVLDTPAGPGSVRPRLPTLFEPGLDIATGPEDGATGRDDVVRELVPAASQPTPARLNMPSGPADPAGELPSVALIVPFREQPAAEPRSPAWPSPSALTAGGSLASGPPWPVTAGPGRPEDAGPVRPVPPQPAHPVRPELTLPEPMYLAGQAAPRPWPLGGGANAIMPTTPADQAPPPARSERVRARYQPDADPAPAPRRSPAQHAHGTAAAEPTVHIAIGRVEIRADHAPPPQPERPVRRHRPAGPDLSEYLQRRGRPR